MKYLLLLALLIGGGYYYYHFEYMPKQQSKVLPALMQKADVGPIEQFEFKQALASEIYGLCYRYREQLKLKGMSVADCNSAFEAKRDACEVKVFRLAPVSLESKEDVVNYGNSYLKCAMPYTFISFTPLS